MPSVGIFTILMLYSRQASVVSDMRMCRKVVANSVRNCLRNANCDEGDHKCIHTCMQTHVHLE